MDPERVRAQQEQAQETLLPESDYELSPQEWQAWEVYLACERQWRVIVGMGVLVYDAIENTAIESAMAMLDVPRKRRRDVLWMVRAIEGEARKLLNQKVSGNE